MNSSRRSSTLLVLIACCISFVATSEAHAAVVAYYNFENDANNQISSNYNGIVSGATLTSDGYKGNAYSFNGTSDFIRVNLDVDIDAFPQLTWGAWVKTNAPIGSNKVLSIDDDGFDRTIGMDKRSFPPGITSMTTFAGSGVVGSGAVKYQQWQFIAASYDQSTNSGIFFVDGVATSFSSSFGMTAQDFIMIGGNLGYAEYWDGQIDEVFIFDEALTASELAKIQANGVIPEVISHWSADVCPLDQNTLIDVESAHNGAVNIGAALNSNGKACQGVSFSGADSDVSIPHHADFQIESGAISFWVNYSRRDNNQGLFSKDANGFQSGGHLHMWLDTSGRVNVRHQTNSASTSFQSNAISTNQWHHVVYSFGSKGGQLYINGQLAASNLGFTTGLTNNQEILVLGASTWSRTSGNTQTSALTDRLAGKMDEVKLYRNQPSARDVTNWMNESPSCTLCQTPLPDLVSHWDHHPCDNVSRPANTIVDFVNDYNGSMLNGAAFTNDALSCQAIDFDGTDDHILVPHNAGFLITDGAVELRFKLDNLSGEQALFAKDAANYEDGGHIRVTVNSAGRVNIRHQTTSASEYMNTTNNTVQAGVWHHLVYSFGAQGAKLYIDGQLVINNDEYFNGIGTNQDDWVFGASNNARARRNSNAGDSDDDDDDSGNDLLYFMEGTIDDIKLYRYQPTDQLVTDWYNTPPATCSCDILIAEYRFQDPPYNGTAGEVIDSSGNGYHGRMIASTAVEFTDPALTGNPGTCGYVSQNDGQIAISGLPVDTSEGAKTTVTFWMKWDGTGDAMPVGWQAHDLWFVENKFGFNTLVGDAYGIDNTGLINNWVHVVAEFTNGDVTRNRIFINGVEQSLAQLRSPSYNPTAYVDSELRIGGLAPRTAHRFHGLIDEFRVYKGRLNTQQVQDIMNERQPCVSPNVHHYEIVHDGSGLTCEAEQVLIRACQNADCSTLGSQLTEVKLKADGAVKSTISFTGSQNVSFNHTVAETVALSLDDATVQATHSLQCSGAGSSGCDMTFTDAGFRFLYGASDTIDTQDAAVNFPQSLTIQAVKNNNGVCQGMFSGAKTIALSQENMSPSGSGGLTFAVDGQALAKHPSTTSKSLSFDSDSKAVLATPVYNDAGLIRLHASINEGGVTVAGNSNSFWVKPHYIQVSARSSGALINGNSANSSKTHPAGEDFQLQLRAVNHSGQTTPNYSPGQLQFQLTRTGPVLAGSVDGQLTYASGQSITSATSASMQNVNVTSFVNGVSTYSNAQYSEVGLLRLEAQDANYGGQGIVVTSNATSMGRFTPHHFTQTIADNGTLQVSCGARKAFHAYSGQLDGLNGAIGYLAAPVLEITAYNKQGAITQNYFQDSEGSANDFMTLSASDIAIVAPTADQVAVGVNGSPLPISSSITTGQLSQNDLTALPAVTPLAKGVLHYQLASSDHFVYPRSANSLVAPFTSNMRFGVSAFTDADAVVANSTQGPSPTGVNIRFGRWMLENSFGPETDVSPLVMRVEHFDGANFITSADNNCVGFDPANITLSNLGLDPSLTGVVGSSGAFIEGISRSLSLSAPGANNQGDIGVQYSAPSWLQYDWDDDGLFDDNPNAIATFGIYRGDDRLFHWREVF